MRELHEIMFPSLQGRWGEILLDECSRLFSSGEDIPLLDVDNQIALGNEMHKRMGIDYSYGGYLTDAEKDIARVGMHDLPSIFKPTEDQWHPIDLVSPTIDLID